MPAVLAETRCTEVVGFAQLKKKKSYDAVEQGSVQSLTTKQLLDE